MQETIFPPQMKCARHLDACLTPEDFVRGSGWESGNCRGQKTHYEASFMLMPPVPGAGATSLQDMFLGFKRH